MKIMFASALIIFTCGWICGCTIPREDVLECGLPAGGKFILTAKYDWEPLAQVIPADVSERLKQDPFQVQFQPRDSFRKQRVQGLSVTYRPLAELAASRAICQEFGVKNGLAYAGTTYIQSQTSREFVAVALDQKLHLSLVPSENPHHIRSELERLKAYRSATAITSMEGKIVFEQSLIQAGQLVVAVFTSESRDGGKTWGDPLITTQARIFEIGKTVADQSFIARPVAINGKKIKAEFPAVGTN
jgi:hypothetical protein